MVSLARSRRRLPFWVAAAAMLLAVLYAPSRVWFVEVEGNETVPARKILLAAEECGVKFWAKSGEIRSEQVKNQILNLVPELQWAGSISPEAWQSSPSGNGCRRSQFGSGAPSPMW